MDLLFVDVSLLFSNGPIYYAETLFELEADNFLCRLKVLAMHEMSFLFTCCLFGSHQNGEVLSLRVRHITAEFRYR